MPPMAAVPVLIWVTYQTLTCKGLEFFQATLCSAAAGGDPDLVMEYTQAYCIINIVNT